MKTVAEDGGLCKAHQKKKDLKQLHFGTILQERPTIWGLVEGEGVGLVDSLKNKEGKEIKWGLEDPVTDWDEHRDNLDLGQKPWGEGERPNKKSSKKTVTKSKTVIKKSSGDAGLDKVIDTKETLKNLKEELKETLDIVENLKEKVTQAELDYKQAKITFVEEEEKEEDNESVCSEDTLAYESEQEEEQEEEEVDVKDFTAEQLKKVYKEKFPEQYAKAYPEDVQEPESKVEELKKKFEPEEEEEEEIYKIITYKDGIDYQINSETKEVVRVDDFELMGKWDDNLEEIIFEEDSDDE